MDSNEKCGFIPRTLKHFSEDWGEKWWRRAIGGKWEELGELQFNFMKDNGLEPHHCLLDIGCGSLRGGVHFIKYLDAGHYYGLEKEEDLIYAGEMFEIPEHGLEDKCPVFINNDNFDMSGADVKFDYMIAQSIFTHILPDKIKQCLVEMKKVLAEDGKFYATFHKPKPGKGKVEDGIQMDLRLHPCRAGEYKGPRYTKSFLITMAESVGLKATYIGKWGHARKQLMILFENAQ